jgi:hypothetical protein
VMLSDVLLLSVAGCIQRPKCIGRQVIKFAQ